MRILRVSHSATVQSWRGRERALRARDHDVTVLAARRWHAGGREVTLAEGEEPGAVPVTTWGRHPALFLYDPRPLWRALGEKWDVIDVHEEPFALATAEVLLLRRLRRNRAPFTLYTAQNLRKRYPIPFRWLERWSLRTASGVSACNSEAAAIVTEKGFAGLPRVIPLGIDPAEFHPVEPPTASSGRAADDTVTVGFLGRLVAEKGIDALLEAVAAESRLRLRIAGSGPLAATLPAATERLGVRDRVELVGTVAPGDVPAFLRGLDVLAVPSLPTATWTEQFGRVAVEAMACGVPVVSSDAGALPEVVAGAGIVVPHGDAAALTRALIDAGDPRAADLRDAGFARAAECTWDAVAEDYLELYRSARHEASAAPSTVRCDVEVVVVAYGAPHLLRRALEPVAGMPVTVVDNSSMPEVAALCDELGVRCIDPGRNGGFAAGVDIALADRLLPGADVLLLNPDARIEPEQIAELHRVLRQEPDIASAAPAQTDAAGRRARVEWPFPTPGNAWLEAVGLGRLQRGPRFVIGSILLLRAEAIAQVGGFDERFFLYAEETDWAYRAHRLGWRHVLAPHVTATHEGAATSVDASARDARFYASQERYFRKHYGVLGWQLARAAGWTGAALRGAVLRGDRRMAAWRRAKRYARGPLRDETQMAAGSGA